MGQWEITTACDVSLGEEFQGDLAGRVLDINADAIGASLSTMSPAASGKVYFEVVNESIGGRLEPSKSAVSRRKNKIGDDADSEVLVGFHGIFPLHETSIHELQHTVDYGNEQLMRREHRRRMIGAAALVGGFFTGEVIAMGVSYEAIGLALASRTVGEFSSIAVFALSSNRWMNVLSTFIKQKFIDRVSEKRADATTKTADMFPSTINI